MNNKMSQIKSVSLSTLTVYVKFPVILRSTFIATTKRRFFQGNTDPAEGSGSDPHAADFRDGMDTWQAPAPAHRLPTTATGGWRPGLDLYPQPNIHQHCLVPDRPRSNFQAFSPFSTGVQSKLFSASWTPTYTHHKPQSSEPLNVLRHQSCPILIPEQLQLCSHSPFRTQPVNHHSANEQEFINPHLLDCCQLPGSAPQISRFQPYIYSRIYIYI